MELIIVIMIDVHDSETRNFLYRIKSIDGGTP